MAPFGRREVLGYVVAETDAAPEGLTESAIKTVRRVVDAEPLFGPNEIELARWMAGFYLCGFGEALASMIPSGRRETAVPAFVEDDFAETGASIALSEEQAAALEAISDRKDSLDDALPLRHHGIGKDGGLSPRGGALLGRGQIDHLLGAGDLAHPPGRRLGLAAFRIGGGDAPFGHDAERQIVGVVTDPPRGSPGRRRSAQRSVRAPVRNLGLIVIDEEHDGSYKSGNVPRYHARQVALKRCAGAGARLVMGSATPSAEAWKLMADGPSRVSI